MVCFSVWTNRLAHSLDEEPSDRRDVREFFEARRSLDNSEGSVGLRGFTLVELIVATPNPGNSHRTSGTLGASGDQAWRKSASCDMICGNCGMLSIATRTPLTADNSRSRWAAKSHFLAAHIHALYQRFQIRRITRGL